MSYQADARHALLALAVAGSLLGLVLAGCATTTKATADAAPAKGGAQLWAEDCGRCHNLRAPDMYSSDQWQVITHDMRIRGELTGSEQREILAFLKSQR